LDFILAFFSLLPLLIGEKNKVIGNDVIVKRQFLSIILGQVHGVCIDCVKNECMASLVQYKRKHTITEKEMESYLDNERHCCCLQKTVQYSLTNQCK
jgi:hypothetical protein